ADGRWRRKQVMEEAVQHMCGKIGEWISSGRYASRQIGILVRSNAQAKLVIENLMLYKNSSGLSYEVISGDVLSLSSNDAIQLLIETIKALIYSSEKYILHRAKMAFLYQLITNETAFQPDYWLHFKTNRFEDLQNILPARLIADWE